MNKSIAKEQVVKEWLLNKGWNSFSFQEECWQAYHNGTSGLLNAPTGSGKTYALWIPAVMEFYGQKPSIGLKVLWITPLRALAKDLQLAMQAFCFEIGMKWQVGVRTGDTSTSEREKYKRNPPDALIITPESLHLLLSQKDYPNYFRFLRSVVIDEWHELLGTKRGVQVEVALSRLRGISDHLLRTWAISATIGNLEQANEVIQGNSYN